jgi:Zn-dependent protease/predicted transcriptional regulator
MKWSAKLGEFAGVSVYVHVTFLLVLIWVGFARWQAEQSLSAVLAGILFILAIFLCVILHEFGHALTARRFGIRTRDITLLPIGGVARLERMPEDPSQELWVTLAGPAVNAVIAGVLYALLFLAGTLAPVGIHTLTTGTFWERLMLFNVILVVFNMIPAFPMDGGRVLRALLAMRMEHARATRIATRFGQSIALLFGILGLFGNPFLILIAVFVWLGATQEAAVSRTKSALGGIRLADAMVTEFRTLSPRDPLARAVEFLLSGSQRDFPVVDADLVVGILTHPGLLAALAKKGEETAVSEVMDRNFEAADSAELVDAVLQRLQSRTCRTVAVMERGRLIGLMTVENLGEFIGVQTAMGSARSARQRIAASTPR